MKYLSFLVLFICTGAFGQRVITYNILQGMRLDSAAGKPAFVNWVKKMDPDILALQEVTGFTQDSLEKLAQLYGHPYAVLLIEGEKYPVAITSKHPITHVQKITDNMDRGFIMAKILDYNIVCLHFTPFDYRTRKKEVDLLLAHIPPRGKKWMVMGDFNAVSPQDSAHYKDGRLVAAHESYEKRRAPIKKLKDGRLDYSVIQKMLDRGFTEAVAKQSPAFVKTMHTKRFEPKKRADVSSRIDFIFVSRDLVKKIKDARVIVDSFTDNYSDHYPVLLDLK
jgi:Exonuclease III